MDIQLYRDAIHANFAMLDNNPPTRRLLEQLDRECFTPQDVVDYLRWSEDVTGEHDSAYNRERMFRSRARVSLRNADFDDATVDDIATERLLLRRRDKRTVNLERGSLLEAYVDGLLSTVKPIDV